MINKWIRNVVLAMIFLTLILIVTLKLIGTLFYVLIALLVVALVYELLKPKKNG